MWWNIVPHARADFQHWHSHEHFPERLGIPGFRRATRWLEAGGANGVFVLYELDAYEVLSSPAYLARLNDPSPWSVRMMPLHQDMVRAQCHVLASHGGAVARHAMTLRLSALPGGMGGLATRLALLARDLSSRPGMAGVHLLRHETPGVPETAEQKIRPTPDQSADLVLVVCAYDEQAIDAVHEGPFSRDALAALGAASGVESARYGLAHSAVLRDGSDTHVDQN